MADLTLRQLQRLARILGVAIGQGYAAAVLQAEADAAVPAPPTPLDRAVAQVLALVPEWVQEAGKSTRAKDSVQARMWDAGRALLRTQEEQADEEQPG